jgi:hypothetical protein
MVCLLLEPAVAPPRTLWTTFSNCSIINTYSMVCLGLEPAVADLTPKDIVEDQNPDCFVMVYAVDDVESFSK